MLKGMIIDTSRNAMAGATVIVLNPVDSSLISYTRSGDNGYFEINKFTNENIILQVTYVGFLPIMKSLKYDSKNILDLGKIILKPIQKELLEIVVKTAKAPISIRGDTIEYNAQSFKVPIGSTVEDLLKKLPGISVDRNGDIRAQGKQVKRIYVDGKSFFGSDPKMATRNLPFEAISKIQVYNDKTEQSKITGVDDGQKDKAINLKLNETHKKGGFGKLSVGTGLDSYRKNRTTVKGNYNRFNPSTQFSVITTGNNTNQNGLQWSDFEDFRGSETFSNPEDIDFGFSNGSFFSFGETGDDLNIPISNGSGNQGFSTNFSSGVNLNHENKKLKLTSNYFFNSINESLQSFSDQLTIISPSKNYTRTDIASLNQTNKSHRISLRLDYKVDSLNTLTLSINSRLVNNIPFNTINQKFFTKDVLTNETDNENIFKQHINQHIVNGLFKHRFIKAKSNLAISFGYNSNSKVGDGSQKSFSHSYIDSINIESGFNQRVDYLLSRSEFKNSSFYLIPLTKKLTLETFYNLSYRKDKSYRKYYDILSASEQSLNVLLSRNFYNNFTYFRIGSSLRFSVKGVNISTGIASLSYKQNGSFVDLNSTKTSSEFIKSGNIFVPNLSFSFDIKSNKYLYGNYSIDIKQPSIRDLQPILDNINPKYIKTGNPNLIPQTNKNYSMGYSSYNPVLFMHVFTGINYVLTENQIVYNQQVDSLYNTLLTPINVNGGKTLSFYAGTGFPLIKTKLTVDINSSYSKNISSTFINNFLNKSQIGTFSLKGQLNYTPNDNLAFYPYANFTRTNASYSINDRQNQILLNYQLGGDLNYKLINKIYANINYTNQIYNNIALDYSQSIPILNLSFYKIFLKDDKGELRLSIFDLLNKNQGISQFSEVNYTINTRSQTLARYFQFTFTYNIKGLTPKIRH